MKSLKLILLGLLTFFIFTLESCEVTPTADKIDQQRQETLQKEGQAQIGMPDIHNFQEKKMVKLLYELRDNPNTINYVYTFSEVSGKNVYLGKCIGYGIPYSTQFSNPEKWVDGPTTALYHLLPQAEPNGLFMPSSSEGTWIMMINPTNPNDIKPVYIEPKIIVSPFPLNN
jgi:hypothetical protein